jgi:predicted component of type VI protein secretion system
MKYQSKYLKVNWTDGMKLNKEIFMAQDQALASLSYDLIATTLSPFRYGIVPDTESFNVSIAVDNQNTIKITVLSCKAITQGGAPISIAATEPSGATDGQPGTLLQVPSGTSDTNYWAVLLVQPYDRVPTGTIDPTETPVRFPFVRSGYEVLLIEDSQIHQYTQHPLALLIGKILVRAGTVKVDSDYLPPCISVTASPDLLGLHAELDSFLSGLELSCSLIVQKIYKKSQQNDLAELALFLCDRIMLHLGQSITHFRWGLVHESPAMLIRELVSLARIIKNTIDLRIGSGKDELMNYLCEWCELNPGELEAIFSNMAVLRYNHNDVNQAIHQIIDFAKVIGKLFSTLSTLEFIGKKKESGLFVKEEYTYNQPGEQAAVKPKRRFFG